VKPELGTRLAGLIAGAIGRGATAWPTADSAPRIRALARGSRPLVVVTTKVLDTRIEVTADAFVGRESLWRRVRRGGSPPLAHAFAMRPIDAETKSFLPLVPLVAKQVVKATGADADTVAVACGDLDGDASPELVIVGRRRVRVGRIRSARLVASAERQLSDIAPGAPSPLREPIAAAWLPSPGVVELGITDRAFAVRLSSRLETTAKLSTSVPWPGGGCAPSAELGVGARVVPCLPGEAPPSGPPGAAGTLDALAGARVVGRDGKVQVVRAERALGTDTVDDTTSGRSEIATGAGAQLAIGDLDGDGSAEVASSLSTRDARADAVVVRSLHPKRGLTERFRVAVPTGIRALAVCPLRASGMAPVVIATGDGVWVIR
jgi:hypothetical protein